jgi:serine-type D-Ala-D-Ala endopeptidase (penicillin-binding protein 7)
MQASITKRRLNLQHRLLVISVLSWLVFVPAHANQISQNKNSKVSSTKNIHWSKASTETNRANRIMNNDSDYEEDTELNVDVRKLPQTIPTNRTGSLSGLIDNVRNKVSGSDEVAPDKLLSLNASAALVMDSNTGEVLYGKNIDDTRPIASISKLMTSIVTLDARLPMDEMIKLQPEDFIGPKKARSSLRPFETYNRAELLLLTLMHSENPAAAALARTYDKGRTEFMSMMNSKAKQLGMKTAFFGDPTGLDSRNAASPRDLAKLVKAAYEYEVIRRFSTTASYRFQNDRGILHSVNTNALVRSGKWNIGLSKTGNLNEAGHCIVMEASVNKRPTVIVLLDARSSQSRTGDANRILTWLGNSF